MDTPSAKGSRPERKGDLGKRRVADGPVLPYAKAFVVQFTAETGVRLEGAAGRVEHLQTGRRSRFESVEDLLACIATLLGADGTASTRRGRPTMRSWRRTVADRERPSP